MIAPRRRESAASARSTSLTTGRPVAGSRRLRSAAVELVEQPLVVVAGLDDAHGLAALEVDTDQPSRSVGRQNACVRDQSIAAVSTRLASLSRISVGSSRASDLRKPFGQQVAHRLDRVEALGGAGGGRSPLWRSSALAK